MLFFIIFMTLFFMFPAKYHLQAELFFSNKESRLHLLNASQLRLNANINNFQGTLKTDPGSSIQGLAINFNHGTIETQQQQSRLKGAFDSALPNSIFLQGGDILHSDPGSVIQLIEISGNNNRIEGQPTFNSALTLFDSLSSVTLALQKKLNSDIVLNGGLVFLEDDLRLAEGVMIQGPGTIECNQSSVDLWGTDGSWSSSLTFIDADAIGINTHLKLSSEWLLSGKGNLNGNGNVLDLSSGGKLIIADNSEIGITNIKIRGMNDQSFKFMGPDSRVKLSSVHLELDGNYSMTLGGIFIDGSITLLLKNHNFLVDSLASITFDGVRGFIDCLNFTNSLHAGQFQAPLPIFVDHILVGTNLSANLNSGNLTVLSSATIAESMAGGFGSILQDSVGTPTGNYLISTVITVSQVGLDDTFWVPVDKNVIVGADTTLDANGNAMFFAHGDQPQMIVLPNNILTLQNIELGRVNQNTFNIHPSAGINIGPNVQFEMNQNLTFSQGEITFVGDANIVNFRGMGGHKVLNITQPRPGQPKVLDIGSNTMVLQDIELSGLSNINFSSSVVDGQVVTGAIALSGGVHINIDQDTDFNFIIEGANNVIRLLRNNIKLTGSISFANAVDNELSIDFILTDGLAAENQVYFGDNFLYLFSEEGKASLYFRDYSARIINQGSNSFVMDKGALLDGNNLFIGTFPIKQLSYDIGLSRGLLLSTDQVNAIDSAFARNFLQKSLRNTRPITAYQLHKKRKEPKKNEEHLIIDSHAKPETDERFQNIQKLFFENADHYSRAISTPLPVTIPIGVGTTVQLADAAGTIQMAEGSSIIEFGASEANQLNIILTDNCTIEQGRAVYIKPNDAFYVLGRKNRIIINDDFIVDGKIYFDTDAELTFECATNLNGKIPKIQLGTDASPFHLNLPKGSRIQFTGRGDAQFAPGSVLKSTAKSTEKRAECFFDNEVIASLSAPGTLQFDGNFNLRVTHQAELFAGKDQHLIIGDLETRRARDSISLVVDNARIRLDGSRPTRRSTALDKAQLSIASCNVTIDFDHKAELLIGPESLFEINTFNKETKLSFLQSMRFGVDSKFTLDKTSEFVLGINDYTNKNYTVTNWDLELATISAEGRFIYIGVPKSSNFYGVPQTLKLNTIGSPEEIMRSYLNRNRSSFDASLYFLDIDGLFYVRTADGQIIQDETQESSDLVIGF